MTTLIFPKLIDCHVHFREPGFPHKATMASEARSANAGGIGTVCEMPNTNPPTNSIAALQDKVQRAEAVQNLDIRFFFSVTQPEHLADIRRIWLAETPELMHLKKRVCGIKLFLENSTGNLKTDNAFVPTIFESAAKLQIPITCHCEDAPMNAAANSAETDTSVHSHSKRRPPESEGVSIQYACQLAGTYGTQLHIAHLSTIEGLNAVRIAKQHNVRVTCEVAPHHLFLSTQDYDTLGTLCKMNPPVRPIEHSHALWNGIMDGTIDCISTDHAPHTGAEKQIKPPLEAPSGVPGTETMLPLLLTVAANKWPHPTSKRPIAADTFTYEDTVRLCFTAPNAIYKLGKIATDTITVDPAKQWTIKAELLHSQCDWTPYENWPVQGALVR